MGAAMAVLTVGGGGLNAHFSSESPSFISFFLHRNLSPSPQYCSGTSPFQLSPRTACILTSEITSSLCESSRDPGKVPLGANSRLCPPQISEKLSQLQARRQETADKWQEKMDWLQLGELRWGPGSLAVDPRPQENGLGVSYPVVSSVCETKRPGPGTQGAHRWHCLALPCAPALGH